MIFKYKQFLLLEGLFDISADKTKEEILVKIEKSIEEIQLFRQEIDETIVGTPMQELIDHIENKKLPKTVKDSTIYFIKLFYNKEFPFVYELLLKRSKEKLESGMSPEDVSKDAEYIKIINYLKNIIKKTINIDAEELDSLVDKFSIGIEKYKKDKEETRIMTPEDPYGEEDWGDISDEERWKKAFEET